MNNVGRLIENTISLAQARKTTISYGDLEALLLSAKRCISYHFAHVSNSSSTTLVVARGCETSCGRGSFCSFYGSICNSSRSSFPPNFGGCGVGFSQGSSFSQASVLASSQAAFASSYHDGSFSGYVWV